MGYIIYRKDTTAIPAQLRDKIYKTVPAAKAALTRFNIAWAQTRASWATNPTHLSSQWLLPSQNTMLGTLRRL